MTLTAHLERMGLLGPRFSGAHAIWIDDTEIELIARHGGSAGAQPGIEPAAGKRHRRHAAGDRRRGDGGRGDRWVIVLGQPEHVRGNAAGRVRLPRVRPGAGGLDRRGGSADAGDRGQRGGARDGGPDRADRAGLQGGSGVPRSGSCQPGAAQQRGEPVGEHRGWGGGARRDGRRPIRAARRRAAGAGLGRGGLAGPGCGGAAGRGQRGRAGGGGKAGAGGEPFLRWPRPLRARSAAQAVGTMSVAKAKKTFRKR